MARLFSPLGRKVQEKVAFAGKECGPVILVDTFLGWDGFSILLLTVFLDL